MVLNKCRREYRVLQKKDWPDSSGSPLTGQTEEPHSGGARGGRPVGFTLFVSKTDRSFLATELEMTPLRLASEQRPGVSGQSFFNYPVCGTSSKN
ncbi:hypothetical protein L596_008617 [Steinernema carpocapsae]|uniref:Uncharacterized protein n=1 Tax=Steinernema carpocapsae TaxID=34508 RepID=A0A4U5PDU9_STECR|nr:hypothetical protein L596_008617 [Steinernema carpocapsae]